MRGLLLALAATGVLALVILAFGYAAGSAGAGVPRLYKNCTALNKKYSHGARKRQNGRRAGDDLQAERQTLSQLMGGLAD